jgi:type IV pilus assembly protein PilV
MKPRINRVHRHQRGVGIIEILVAVLVLCIGLLGLAGLQLRTLRNNESALERSMAVAETHAVVDAMRADRSNAKAGLYNILMGATASSGSTFRATVVYNWRQNLVSALGSGASGQIFCNGTLCTIDVQWDDSRGTGGSATQRISTQVQL